MPPAAPAQKPPSPQQLAILDYLQNDSGHVVIHATAGAGKTTTLVQIAWAQPSGTRCLFLAFARDAAHELQHRLGASAVARTVHSLGREVLGRDLQKRNLPLNKPQAHKYLQLSRQLLQRHAPELATTANSHYLNDLAGLVRLNLSDATDETRLLALATSYDLWPPLPDTAGRLHRLLPDLIRLGSEIGLQGTVDFTDMIYLPSTGNLTLPAFDLVCVDEAQDYSPAALELTLRLSGQGARLVFVGDPRQTIFGFAGASSNAMELITRRTTARILPLAVSYRCPRLHVELASRLAPEMQAASGAAAGSIQVVPDADLEACVRPGDLILCRVNAPLLAACLRIIRLGLPCTIRGVDLAGRLLKLADDVLGNDPGNYEQKLTRSQRAAEVRLQQLLPERGQAAPVQAQLSDELACLRQLCRDLAAGSAVSRTGRRKASPLKQQLERSSLDERIGSLFTPQPNSVVLSTIHRAKGQEADRVLLLYPELLPAPYARSDEAIRAEACIQFVALTRARQELIFVEQPESAAGGGSAAAFAPTPEGAENSERDTVISNWQQILAAARSGRRHRRQHVRHARHRQQTVR
jgi:DNA helicase-2/ATP-dependent DNA helicase PcrA